MNQEPKFKIGDTLYAPSIDGFREFGQVVEIIKTQHSFYYNSTTGGCIESYLCATKEEAIAKQIKTLESEVEQNCCKINKLESRNTNLQELIEKLKKNLLTKLDFQVYYNHTTTKL